MKRIIDALSAQIERLLKVPPPPSPPWGDPGSARTIRPGRGFLKLLFLNWVLHEGWAIGVGLVTLFAPHWIPDIWFLSWLTLDFMVWIEAAFLIFVFAFLPVTIAKVLLDFRSRWYILTDRSLRLREGVWTVREMTISLSNVQNVALRQGPFQRLLGIADVEVHTAGGGESITGEEAVSHRGVLRGITDAEAIRDAILAASRHALPAIEPQSRAIQAPLRDPAIVLAARTAAREAAALATAVAAHS